MGGGQGAPGRCVVLASPISPFSSPPRTSSLPSLSPCLSLCLSLSSFVTLRCPLVCSLLESLDADYVAETTLVSHSLREGVPLQPHRGRGCSMSAALLGVDQGTLEVRPFILSKSGEGSCRLMASVGLLRASATLLCQS